MSARSFILVLASVLVAVPATAQVSSVVGPPVAPIGCPVTIAISNDTNASVFTGVCPFVVRDSSLAVIYSPICIAIVVEIQSGNTFTTTWNQIDDNGLQVVPGVYVVDVFLPGGAGIQNFAITIGGADAAVALGGVPRIGTSRNLALCSPLDGGLGFLMAASLSTTPGLLTCAGGVPLTIDPIFTLSLTPGNGIFNGFQGTLDNSGQSFSPSIAIPNAPPLIGATVYLAFVAFDTTLACPITRISAATPVTIQ